MRKPLAWSLAAGLLLAGSVATGAYAAGPSVSTPSVTTQAQSTVNDPAGQNIQSGVQQGSESQTGLDTEKSVAEAPEADAQATTAVDPAGGPDLNVQQGLQSQSGAQDGAAGGQ